MRIATMTLLVDDYELGREWFVERLGFAVVEDTPLDESNKDGSVKRWLLVEPSAGGVRLLLARASNEEERAAVGHQGGGRVICFLETDDFSRDHARMLAAGVHFDEAPRHESYGSVAVFRDVSGNPWDLIGPARSRDHGDSGG